METRRNIITMEVRFINFSAPSVPHLTSFYVVSPKLNPYSDHAPWKLGLLNPCYIYIIYPSSLYDPCNYPLDDCCMIKVALSLDTNRTLLYYLFTFPVAPTKITPSKNTRAEWQPYLLSLTFYFRRLVLVSRNAAKCGAHCLLVI